MYNYYNLNDVEFENLCKDIMERMLSIKLRRFAKGRDDGIDLTDNVLKPKIIVQVKHYIRSSFSNLRTSLKNELANIEEWKPEKYFICCGMGLTPTNIQEIYNMFSDYMESDENIITLIEIDDFLQNSENSDIVRKHYKLWLHASGILNQIQNQNIFIDCESLLSDIHEESKYFVQTEVYNQCLDCLNKHRIIMITGHPGVGKTITSKMLVLYYASQEYSVRYTTNGDISDIKKSLSIDKDNKEVIFLDDCLGQHYFNLKETQGNELTSLANFVKMHENKILILNSRLTILNEAKERDTAFNIFFENKKIDELTINMDTINLLEKALIFYNHLVSKNIPNEYRENIKTNKNYLKIVMHNNFTPRIIEYVTLTSNYLNVPADTFSKYILNNLSNPNDIWKNEYCQRIKEEDRAFLTTLYSLTDTTIDKTILKKCFNKRLSQMSNIDYTINNFESVLARLNQSIVKIVDNKDKMCIGVINPSVNDFLKQILSENELEKQEIQKSALNYMQLRRCYSLSEIPKVIDKMFTDNSILDINFETKDLKYYFMISYICENKLQNKLYQESIYNYFSETFGKKISTYSVISPLLEHNEILDILLHEPLLSFYKIENIFNVDIIKNMLKYFELRDLISVINIFDDYFTHGQFNEYYYVFEEALKSAIGNYISDFSVSEYCECKDINHLIDNNKIFDGIDYDINKDQIYNTISGWVDEEIYNNIQNYLDDINNDILKEYKIPDIDQDYSDEIDNIIYSYLEPDSGSWRDNSYDPNINYEKDIELIFER